MKKIELNKNQMNSVIGGRHGFLGKLADFVDFVKDVFSSGSPTDPAYGGTCPADSMATCPPDSL